MKLTCSIKKVQIVTSQVIIRDIITFCQDHCMLDVFGEINLYLDNFVINSRTKRFRDTIKIH